MANDIIYYDSNGSVVQNRTDGNYLLSDPFVSLSSPNLGLSFPNSTHIRLAPRNADFSPTTLGNTKHVYTSPYSSDIIQLARYFADWSCAYKTIEGSLYVIEVDVPWDTITNTDFNISEFVSEQWEIIPSSNVKPLAVNGILTNPFNPPNFIGNYVILPDILKIAVQQAYDNKFAFTLPTTITGSLSSFIPYAQQILNYMRGGVEGVPSFTQTLKRTAIVDVRNVNRAFQKSVDFQRASLNAEGTINYMLSTNDLINGYSVQSSTAQMLNPSYSKKITITGIEPTQYYAYAGWLITPPTAKFITPNKVQYEQLFTWDEYLGGLYYIHSNPNQFQLAASAASNPNGYAPTQ